MKSGGEKNIESETIRDAAVLTALGMGTAFTLLVLMIVVITGFRQLSEQVLDRVGEKIRIRSKLTQSERRLRSLAAVIAITALYKDTLLEASPDKNSN